MLEDFSANLEQDGKVGEDAFSSDLETQEGQTETAPASPAETKPGEANASQGADNTLDVKTEPFHRHPRWIKTQEELAELRKFKEEAIVKQSTYDQIVSKIGQPTTKIPEWYPKTGNQQVDEQRYKEYLSYEAGVKAQIKQELLEEQSKEAEKKTQEEKKWTNWVNDSLDKLEDEGKTFDRNELQAIALKYLPSDEHGNIDFGRAYEIMTELKKVQFVPQAQTDARKRIGDLTNTGKQTAERPKPKFETSSSLRGKSWDSLIRE